MGSVHVQNCGIDGSQPQGNYLAWHGFRASSLYLPYEATSMVQIGLFSAYYIEQINRLFRFTQPDDHQWEVGSAFLVCHGRKLRHLASFLFGLSRSPMQPEPASSLLASTEPPPRTATAAALGRAVLMAATKPTWFPPRVASVIACRDHEPARLYHYGLVMLQPKSNVRRHQLRMPDNNSRFD